MSTFLRVEMLILALAIFYYIVRMINKNAFSLRRSTPWLIIGLGIIFIAVFPGVVSWSAHKLGFALTMNFLLFVGLLFVFILELLKTSSDTKKDQQIKVLIQEISLLKKEVEDNEK